MMRHIRVLYGSRYNTAVYSNEFIICHYDVTHSLINQQHSVAFTINHSTTLLIGEPHLVRIHGLHSLAFHSVMHFASTSSLAPISNRATRAHCTAPLRPTSHHAQIDWLHQTARAARPRCSASLQLRISQGRAKPAMNAAAASPSPVSSR